MSDRLSSFQQQFTGPEPEFVFGEVYGVRSWFLDPQLLALQGQAASLWDITGVNQAVCKSPYEITNVTKVQIKNSNIMHEELAEKYVRKEISDLFPQAEETRNSEEFDYTYALSVYGLPEDEDSRSDIYTVYDVGTEEMISTAVNYIMYEGIAGPGGYLVELCERKKRPEHRVASPSCSCGFYAYWSTDELTGASSPWGWPKIHGIIKGYGYVTQGTLGFRAEKAEIVAITVPQIQQLEQFLSRGYYSMDGHTRVFDALVDTLDGSIPVLTSTDSLAERLRGLSGRRPTLPAAE